MNTGFFLSIAITPHACARGKVPYSRKLLREKTFTNFVVLEPPVIVFSITFGRAIPIYDRF